MVIVQRTETGEEVLRMCVAVKKKLQLYFWKDREFHELQVKSNSPLLPSLWVSGSCCRIGSQLKELTCCLVIVKDRTPLALAPDEHSTVSIQELILAHFSVFQSSEVGLV